MYCSPLDVRIIQTQDELINAYADLLDKWSDCAKRHKALIDWSERK